MRALVGDGDWSARGVFLRNCESFRPAVEAVSAVDALTRLFPPHVVQAMLDSGDRRSLSMVFPLFLDGWTPGHGTLLHLGADLSRCRQWFDHRQLVTRLRTYAEHDGARFEVGLWAGACREGLVATYNDPGQGPNCDLVLRDGPLTVHVEAKAVDIATVSHNRSELLRAISDSMVPFIDRFGDGGYQLAVAPHRALLVAALNDLPEFEKLAEDFRRELQKWCRDALRPLAADVPVRVAGVGDVRLSTLPGNEGFGYALLGLPEPSFEKEVARALRPVAKARRQLAAGPDVVRAMAVWTGTTNCPAGAAVNVARTMIRERPERFEGVDWIVFVNSHTRLGDWVTTTEAVATRRDVAPVEGHRWLRALARWQRCS